MTHLALRIYKSEGEILEQAIPLISVGEFPDNFKPRSPRLVEEKESWLIIHANEYKQYSYYVKGENSVYAIYLLLPISKKMSLNSSTFDLLSDAYKLITIQEGLGFNDGAFEGLLKNYVLDEDDELTVPFMSGKEPVSFRADSKTQIAALLKFSKYKELESVCQLEIGLSCKTTINLPIKSKAKNVSKPSSIPQKPSRQTTKTKHQKQEVEDYSSSVTPLFEQNEKKGLGKNKIIVALAIIAACIIAAVFIINRGDADTSESILAQNEVFEDSVEEKVPVTKSYGLENVNIRKTTDKKVSIKEDSEDRAFVVELANKGNLAEILSYQKKSKCLTKGEVNAIQVVLENVKVVFPQSTAAMHEKLRNKVSASKPFTSVQDIVELKQELLDIALGKKN